MNLIYSQDNLLVLKTLQSGSIDLIYIDPPFNTGKTQQRTQIRVRRSLTGFKGYEYEAVTRSLRQSNGSHRRKGFGGHDYDAVPLGTRGYEDQFGDEFLQFLEPRLREAHRVLAEHGTLYFHIDYREVHHCRLLLDRIFGSQCFLNEIIWAYDYGGRAKTRWPAKHDNILVYAKNPKGYILNENGKAHTPDRDQLWRSMTADIWWHTIVPTNGKERTGYPTQKPLGILKPLVTASSKPGDLVLDFFAGSGTTGECCLQLGRRFILVDDNPQAQEVMRQRFNGVSSVEWQTIINS